MECPRCGFSGSDNAPHCPQCGAWTNAAWPPAPTGRIQPVLPENDAGEALHQGWRLLLLSFIAPPVFLPLAAWQGVEANRRSGSGAGSLLLMLCAGISAFWLAALLLWLRFEKGF